MPASSKLVPACCHCLWDNVSPFWDCDIATSDLHGQYSHSRPETSVTAEKPEPWGDILRLKNHKPDRERHLIRKWHHSGYFNALDLCCPLSGAPSVTGLWCQVTLADDFPLFLTVEQGHVWSGCAMRGPDCGQEGKPWFRSVSSIYKMCSQWHGPGSEALWKPAQVRTKANSLPSPVPAPPSTENPCSVTMVLNAIQAILWSSWICNKEVRTIANHWKGTLSVHQTINSRIKIYLCTCYWLRILPCATENTSLHAT